MQLNPVKIIINQLKIFISFSFTNFKFLLINHLKIMYYEI